MRSIFTDNVLDELRKLSYDAYKLRSLFEKSESTDILFENYKFLDNRFEKLRSNLPLDFECTSNLERHISFIEHYLTKKQPENCLSDIIDICETDINTFEIDYNKYAYNKFVDAELSEKLISLIDSNNHDSAVRKALLILTDRLRTKFNISSEKDGKELINDIFGQKGKLSNLPSEKREPLRDFYSGIYGLLRNDYMHNLIEPNNIEAINVLNIIHYALIKLEDIHIQT